MNEQLNYYLYVIQTMSAKTKIIFLLIVNAAITFYLYNNVIGKTKTEYARHVNLRNTKEGEYRELMELKTQFPELQKEIDALTGDLQQKLRKLPNDSEIPALLKSISKEAVKAGLKIIEFTPLQEVASGYFFMIPISVSVEGTYHQLNIFSDKVSKFPRIVNIANISMKTKNVVLGKSILDIKFELQAFRFKDRVDI